MLAGRDLALLSAPRSGPLRTSEASSNARPR